MSYERRWERLVEQLDALGHAHEVAPNRIEVTWQRTDGAQAQVEIVMTRDDWDTWTGTVNGDFQMTADEVQATVLDHSDGKPYLVFDTYDLVPSDTETLPPDPGWLALQARIREHPDDPLGWFAVNRDGSRDLFADHPDDD